MTCDEYRAQRLAGDLDAQTDAHLRGCAACRAAGAGLDQLSVRLAEPAVWEAPSPALADDVLAAITAAAHGTAPTAAPGSPGTATGDHGRPTPRPARPWRRAVLAIAAALLVVAGAVALVGRGPGDGPDWQVALEATSAAPRAVAEAKGWNTATGVRIELDVSGLPPSGDDAYYAMWLTSPDGRHVPVGTFRDSGTVYAWSGVSRADFPRFWVTLEPNDQDESLSGPTVLDTPAAPVDY